MEPLVFGWKHSSKSAKQLAAALNAPFSCPRDERNVVPKPGQIVINWGGGMGAHFMFNGKHRVINEPDAIARSVCKLDTFRALTARGVPIPEWTTKAEKAFKWIQEGHTVFGRQDLEARAGRGIVLMSKEPLPVAETDGDANPRVVIKTIHQVYDQGCAAYTKRFIGKWELKVHVAFGKVHMVWSIDEDTEDWSDHDGLIRNYNNGYVFNYAPQRTINKLHPSVFKNCIKAIQALGLDFGVVDCQVAANGKDMVVFETNTAPAIDDYDAAEYAKMFRKELKIK